MEPNFAIINEKPNGDNTILEVDTAKASYQGRPWRSLGDFGKRKWENLLVLKRNKERIKIIYV
jgi:hypothetical protein